VISDFCNAITSIIIYYKTYTIKEPYYNIDMPVCGKPSLMDCAHEASVALLELGYDLRNSGTANC
jgi:hypothetical protein